MAQLVTRPFAADHCYLSEALYLAIALLYAMGAILATCSSMASGEQMSRGAISAASSLFVEGREMMIYWC